MQYNGFTYRDPLPLHKVVENAMLENPNNTVIMRLANDYKVLGEMLDYIKDVLGQRLAINLGPDYSHSRVSLAMYTGNGVVVKIIPADCCDRLGNVPLLLPSINRRYFEGENGRYVVKTYPWVSPSHADKDEIAEMKVILATHGLRFIEGDDRHHNIHVLPDGKNTLVGIDSDMYEETRGKVDQEKVRAWIKYVHDLFPVYAGKVVPRQEEGMEFKFMSLAKPVQKEDELPGHEAEKPSKSKFRLFGWLRNFPDQSKER